MTSKPLVRRTFATLRSAEFGFLGVVVYTRVHTPRFCGEPCNAGTWFFSTLCLRGMRTSWLIVAIERLPLDENRGPFGPPVRKVRDSNRSRHTPQLEAPRLHAMAL